MNLAFNLPVNSVSFGQTSTLILRTIFDRIKSGQDIQVKLFPIGGGYDLSSQKKDVEFEKWLNSCILNAALNHKRSDRIFKLWHLNGSLESFSEQQSLLSFYELDSPTQVELNIARNNRLFFSSKYTCEVFKSFGVEAGHVPLAFDSYNFRQTQKTYFSDDRIVFNLCGKFEKRKHHAKTIKAWMKKYGNDAKYALQCAIYNPFLNPQQNSQIIAQTVLEGKHKPFNVNFFPAMPENQVYNDFLNSGNIIVGMGNESWGLPEFHSVAIGKHSVILDYNGHREWSNPENSILITPNGKEEAYDGMFFNKGQSFNQGNNPTFNEEELINGFELAVKRVEDSVINTNGLTLQNFFSSEKFVDSIITSFGV